MIFERFSFTNARPIWEKGTETLQNRTLLFTSSVKNAKNATLRISGAAIYSVYINGEFTFYGPARAGKGYCRVDEIPIGALLTKEANEIAIICSGYNCNSFYTLNEPSFLCAEIVSDGEVLCATGSHGWRAYSYDNRIRKVQRYTTQRTFCEVYDFLSVTGDCLSAYGHREVELTDSVSGDFIKRDLSLPDFERESAVAIIGGGSIAYNDREHEVQYFMEDAGVTISGYAKDDLDVYSAKLADGMDLVADEQFPSALPFSLSGGRYATARMKGNLTGLITLEVECHEDTELYLTFDEILTDGRVDPLRGCTNVIIYKLKGGRCYKLTSVEPYTYQYINVAATRGSATVKAIGMIRVGFNQGEITARLNAERADEQISRIYNAAVETFRQNTLDVYMDCPSRERAGWLCDSFFTSRVERLLTGKSRVEHNFLSNFIMAKAFPGLPNGVIPMCYPSENLKGYYIPNWMMWYVLELKEYLERTSDRALVDEAKALVLGALSYLKGFENGDGMLEKLDGWVFVEWSKANSLVQDVNYPSNMLYCMFKRTIGELYGDEALISEADALRAAIRAKSRYGLFFCDNSVFDENGELKLSGQCTESCQYYAFFTGVATKEEDGELWQTLVDDFGPERKENGKWPEIYFANAFIGNYLRLELLCKAGYDQKLEENIRGYFDYMATRTGTLWEHDAPSASCNHGFASHVLVWLKYLGYVN